MLKQKLLTGFGGGRRGLEIKTLSFFFHNCHETQMRESNLCVLAAFNAKEIWIIMSKTRLSLRDGFQVHFYFWQLVLNLSDWSPLTARDCFDLIWSSSGFALLGHRGEICHTAGGVKFWTNIMSTCLPSTELLTLWPHLQLFSISPLFQCTPKTGSLLETEWQILEFFNNEIKFSSSKLMMDDKWSFRS